MKERFLGTKIGRRGIQVVGVCVGVPVGLGDSIK